MVGSVQEGQRQSVNAVVDRLVEGGVSGGSVERQINVDDVRPLKRERKARCGESKVCSWARVSHV